VTRNEKYIITIFQRKLSMLRIIKYEDFGDGQGRRFPKKYLYDDRKSYDRQLKSKKTYFGKIGVGYTTILMCEELQNNNWVLLEEVIFPGK